MSDMTAIAPCETGHLMKYDQACRAVAEAKTLDEARSIKDQAEGLRAYARQANNRQLEIDAAEIRVRAERKVGQILKLLELPKKFQRNGMTKFTQPLEALGIDPILSAMSQRLASVTDETFEKAVTHWREEARHVKSPGFPLNSIRRPVVPPPGATSWINTPLSPECSDEYRNMRGLDGVIYGDLSIRELPELRRAAFQMWKVLELIERHAQAPSPDNTVRECISSSKLQEFICEAKRASQAGE